MINRDPAGFIFFKDGRIFRAIRREYEKEYNHFKNELYVELLENKLIIPHTERSYESNFIVIEPEKIPFISYPWEWCFSALKDAALTTLNIMKIALKYDMVLKDASYLNIQFIPNPVLIDTTSFEFFDGKPWVAYRQFCQHFLYPLLLMKKIKNTRFLKLFPDGFPIDFAMKFAPKISLLNPGIFIHLFLQYLFHSFFKDKKTINKKISVNKNDIMNIVLSLERTIKKLKIKVKSVLQNYYDERISYTSQAFESKVDIVRRFVDIVKPKRAVDFGANTGFFSSIVEEMGAFTIPIDNDFACIENIYRNKEKKRILPLFVDLVNCDGGSGWLGFERPGFFERLKDFNPDLGLFLAILHHIRVVGGIPLEKIVELLSLFNYSIVEFVPKDDKIVENLIVQRRDVFYDYTEENFEKILQNFLIIKKEKIKDSKRVLYLIKRKE